MKETLNFIDIVRLALFTVENELHGKTLKTQINSQYELTLKEWRKQLNQLLVDFDDGSGDEM